MTNQVRITLNKQNSIQINQNLPITKTTKATIEHLRYCVEFNMITVEFDNLCYPGASEKLQTREYNKYMRRINQIAKELGLTVALVENKVIRDYTMPNQYVAVLVR